MADPSDLFDLGEDEELILSSRDERLLVPGGGEAPDHRAAAMARALRRLLARRHQAVAAGRPVPPDVLADIQALRPLLERMMNAYGEAAAEADRIDREAALAVEQHERFLADTRARLTYLGKDAEPESWAIAGWAEDGDPVAFSRDGGQILMAMGAIGMGKTYLAMVLIEACLRAITGLSSPRHRKTAVVAFHTNLVNEALPQFLSGLRKNPRPGDLEILARRLGVTEPGPIERMTLVLPEWLIEQFAERLRPWQAIGLRVVPLKVRLSQLGHTALEALLDADDEAQYVQEMLEVARELGPGLTIEDWHQAIDAAALNETQKDKAHRRLRLLGHIASPEDGPGLWEMVEPGTLTIFMLAGKRIGKKDVLPLCVALLTALSESSEKHGPFQRIFLLDEVNRLDRNTTVWPVLLQVARQIRQQGSMLILLAQDCNGMPDEFLNLVTIFALFRVNSPEVLEHVRRTVGGYRGVRIEQVRDLPKGVALVWALEATDPRWKAGPRALWFRPMCCEHGGDTKAEI